MIHKSQSKVMLHLLIHCKGFSSWMLVRLRTCKKKMVLPWLKFNKRANYKSQKLTLKPKHNYCRFLFQNLQRRSTRYSLTKEASIFQDWLIVLNKIRVKVQACIFKFPMNLGFVARGTNNRQVMMKEWTKRIFPSLPADTLREFREKIM